MKDPLGFHSPRGTEGGASGSETRRTEQSLNRLYSVLITAFLYFRNSARQLVESSVMPTEYLQIKIPQFLVIPGPIIPKD